jgi:hypothetical protein
MRHLSLLLATVAVIVAGSVIYNRVREDRWRPMPGGGTIRLLAVTYEQNPHFKTREVYSTAVLALYRGRWPVALGSPPLKVDPQYPRPRLAFGLATREIGEYSIFLQARYALLFGDEQLPGSGPTTDWNSEDRNKLVLAAVGFPFVPHTPLRLRLRVMRDGQSLDFDVANPCYDPNFSEWKAGPLPQTRMAGNLAITLRDLQVDRTKGGVGEPLFKYTLKPGFDIQSSDGAGRTNVSHQYAITNSFGEEIKDGAGYSHPVWKVQCKISPSGLKPDDDPNALSVDFFVKPPPPRDAK